MQGYREQSISHQKSSIFIFLGIEEPATNNDFRKHIESEALFYIYPAPLPTSF
jgi:hypothetical protein